MDACHTHTLDAPCTSEGRKEGQPADMFGGKRGLKIWPGRWGQPCATLQHILYTIYNYTTTISRPDQICSMCYYSEFVRVQAASLPSAHLGVM